MWEVVEKFTIKSDYVKETKPIIKSTVQTRTSSTRHHAGYAGYHKSYKNKDLYFIITYLMSLSITLLQIHAHFLNLHKISKTVEDCKFIMSA